MDAVLPGDLLVSKRLSGDDREYVLDPIRVLFRSADWLDMNYVSAVYGIVFVVIAVDWVVRGKREFRGQTVRHGEIEARSHVQ